MPNTSNQVTEWRDYSKLVLEELRRLNECYESLSHSFNKEIKDITVELAVLKLKAGVWGLLGGAIAMALTLLVYWLTKGN